MIDPPQSTADVHPWQPRVYEELRGLAATLLRDERRSHTLDPTELVHEVWIRLLRSRNAGSLPRSEFLGLAAQSMRRILIEHARHRHRRGGDWRRTTLSGKALASDPATFLVDFEVVLRQLTEFDPELTRIVELRFFAGATVPEISAALGHSERTIKRRWRFARAWLHHRITEGQA